VWKDMSGKLIQVASNAYAYPLLIKHLLHAPMLHSPDREIVYRDKKRFTYMILRERISRLASGLAALGVKPGDTVGIMDWDSHRFLESFFSSRICSRETLWRKSRYVQKQGVRCRW
jgi:fatty-acyl-CoA synthase